MCLLDDYGTGLAFFGVVMGATLGGWGGTLGGIGNIVGLTHRVGRLLENARRFAEAEEAQQMLDGQHTHEGGDDADGGGARPPLQRALTAHAAKSDPARSSASAASRRARTARALPSSR